MADVYKSYDFSAIQIPDVMQMFETVVAKQPTLLNLIGVDTSIRAKATKHEWMQFKSSRSSFGVASAYTAADGVIVLDDVTGLSVGNVLGFTNADETSVTFKARITAINTGTNTITIDVIGTDENMADTATAYIVARGVSEMSSANPDTNRVPERKYNYTQILREDFQLSRTTLQSALYGLNDNQAQTDAIQGQVDFQAAERLNSMAWELNQSLIEGVRYASDATEDARTMGGLMYYLGLSSDTQYDASASAISETIINNAMNKVVDNGGRGGSLNVLLCNANQARKISAFNTSGTNPVVQVQNGDTRTGNYVVQYQSDLAGTNGGSLTTIVVDRNMPKDKVVVFSNEKTKLVPMQDMQMWDSTANDTDGRRYSMLAEYTFQWQNYETEGILIDNLTV